MGSQIDAHLRSLFLALVGHRRSSEANSLPRKWSNCRHASFIMPSLYPGMKLNIKSWFKRLEFNFEQAGNRKSAKFKSTTKTKMIFGQYE